MIGIYKFTNKITNESYVGQSVNIQKRYIQHKNRCKEAIGKCIENTYFHLMVKKYGFDNFNFEIIEECKKEELNEKEMFYISYYNTLYPNGYNLTAGGSSRHSVALRDASAPKDIRYLLKNTNLSICEIGEMYEVSHQTISDINTGKIWYDENVTYPVRGRNELRNKSKKIHYCKDCGKIIDEITKTGLCWECYIEQRRVNIPDKHTLFNLLLDNSFEYVASKYGVSSNAVRKWCDIYNIPRHSKYYRSVS